MDRAHLAVLTPRERQVFDRVVRGDTNKHAARLLGCTERKIDHRLRRSSLVDGLFKLCTCAGAVSPFHGTSAAPSAAIPAP
ncbi:MULTISPECIES: LuxR C-terminal-related transcriptional regulator [unclassified Bradyrhizobium]|nr:MULTISPECIES: LuxR C-terminal-related transcriptional regulator [unclassified Bradyrhizobium]